jgi:tetratricopeptide (TPR) repeat protein
LFDDNIGYEDRPADVGEYAPIIAFVILGSNKVKILFLAANPVDVVARLRVEQELREIQKKIHLGTHSSQMELVAELAVRAVDLQAALLRHRPDIVHFSGHCSKTSGIVLEDENGRSQVVSRKALSDLFSILRANIRVVVLNACYAIDQAQALTATIDCAIGMNDAIEDRAALKFAAHFYQSLAFGCSVEEAFELARNQLDIEEIKGAHIPELLVRDGANPAEIRIGNPSHLLIEPESGAFDKDGTSPVAIAGNDSEIMADGLVMRGIAGEKPQVKPHRAAFFSGLFASVAVILTTDSLRRFLSVDGGWPHIAATIIQLVFILFAIIAILFIGLSLLSLSTPLMGKAARLGIFNGSARSRKASVLTFIAAVIAFGLWMSLPVFAHYYNERGVRFQYAEPPDLSRARESFQQAVKLNPSYAPAHYNLALAEEDLQPEKAMEEYLLALRYDSHIYPAYNNLARLYLLRGQGNDYENALNLLSQAVSLSPQDEHAQYSLNKNLGWANYALKHHPLAETYLRRAISLRNNQGAAAHCLLAYVLKEQGKPGVIDECYDCVALAPGEKDVEAKWVNDARDCIMKGSGR